MADYRKPKPIDPVWYRRHHFLRIRCQCGRRVILPLDDVVQLHRVPQDHCLYHVIDRLICRSCGQRPVFADVSASRDWGAG